MRPNGHVARRIGMRDVYRVLKERPEENRQLGRSRSRWEDKIKTDIQAMGWGVMDWTDRTQNRDRWRALVSVVMKLQFP
jgi:hypothetical protein